MPGRVPSPEDSHLDVMTRLPMQRLIQGLVRSDRDQVSFQPWSGYPVHSTPVHWGDRASSRECVVSEAVPIDTVQASRMGVW